MLQDTRATINDLPVEILDLIFEDLDDYALANLAGAGHGIGLVALRRTGAFESLSHTLSGSEFLVKPGIPMTHIAAIVAAMLWYPISIKSITYLAARDDAHDFLDDMRNLSVLIARLPPRSLELLKLDITIKCVPLPGRRCVDLNHPIFACEQKVWAEVLIHLVEKAISAGCTAIELYNGPLPSRIPWYRTPRRTEANDFTTSLLQYAASSLASRIPNILTRAPALPACSGLKSIVFSTGLFFMDDFLDDTLELLRTVSNTLQHLTIRIPSEEHQLECSRWVWWKLATFLHLPLLRTLTLQVPFTASIIPRREQSLDISYSLDRSSIVLFPQDLLFVLLAQHSCITFLTLDYLLEDHHSTVSRFSRAISPRRILPKLEILEAWPEFILWLIPLLTYTPPSTFSQNSLLPRSVGTRPWTSSSSLKSVRILTRGFSHLVRDIPTLDQAILALNTLFPVEESPKSPKPPPQQRFSFLTIQLNFESSFWNWWIRKTILTHLSSHARKSRVTNLTLEIIPTTAFASESSTIDVYVISEWLSLAFPDLRDLTILGKPFEDAPSNEKLSHSIVFKCRSLRRFKLNDAVTYPVTYLD